jgi:mRNA turnover protein 4
MQAMETKETKDFARVGQIATETIVCPEGPVKNCFDVPMSHTLEAMLRKHGLPTKLNKGVVECVNEKIICKRGVKLSSDQCALLRQFGYKLATFKLRLVAGWEKSTGETEVFMNEDDSEEILDYGTDEEEEDRFASDGLPKSMMLPEGML